jgi:light-regulated signal transduction histidine kinase (bacteriophytochrome)
MPFQDDVEMGLKEKEIAIVNLKARNNNLQQFSYICSHDFKEPLRNIGSYSSLIQKKMSNQQLSQEYKEYFKFIDSSVVTLSNIIQALKLFTDINGSDHFGTKKIILKDLFQNAIQELSGLIEEKKAEIVFNNNSGKDFIYSSEYGLKLIIQNLVQNALKFNQSPAPKVIVTLENSNESLLLKVKDNGVGVEEQYLKYIFEPFKTMNNKSTSNSSGLGLAICKEITNKISGEIWVESKVGEGSTFYLSLKNAS